MELLPRYSDCFFCSKTGDGPHLKLTVEDGMVISEFVLMPKFQGYSNVAHAGIVTGILDEAMWWSVFLDTLSFYFTTRMETEFLRPVFVNAKHRVSARVIEKEKRIVRAEASIKNANDKECARVLGTFKPGRTISGEAFAEKLDFLDVSPRLKELVLKSLKE